MSYRPLNEYRKFYPDKWNTNPEKYEVGREIVLEYWDFQDGYYSHSQHEEMKPFSFRVISRELGSPKYMREDSIPHELWTGASLEEAIKQFEFWVHERSPQ